MAGAGFAAEKRKDSAALVLGETASCETEATLVGRGVAAGPRRIGSRGVGAPERGGGGQSPLRGPGASAGAMSARRGVWNRLRVGVRVE